MAAAEPRRRSSSSSRSTDRGTTGGPRRRPGKGIAAWAIRSAVEQLQELLGQASESVSALKSTEAGWEADVEVLDWNASPKPRV